MKSIQLPKLISALVTPIINGKIDVQSLLKLFRFQVNNQVSGMFILGTTGEFNVMPLALKKDLIDSFYKIIADENKEISVLIGVSVQELSETVELINHCVAKKHDVAAFVLAPMFGEGDPEEKLNLVLQNTDIPIMLYNNPGVHDGTNIPMELLKKLAKHPQVIGIKDSSGDQEYFDSLLSLVTEEFCIYQGYEDNLVDDLKKPGVFGTVSGTANIVPMDFHNLVSGVDVISSQENILNIKKQLSEYSNYIEGIKTMLKGDCK